MAILTVGINLSPIAIRLGYEGVSTTYKHMVVFIVLKERAHECSTSKKPFGNGLNDRRCVSESSLLAFFDSMERCRCML